MAGEGCNMVSKKGNIVSTMGKDCERGDFEGVNHVVDQELVFPLGAVIAANHHSYGSNKSRWVSMSLALINPLTHL